jgi:hypothetical protein
MSNKKVNQDIKDLNNGILPDSLNFSLKPKEFDLKDLAELQYNAFYRSYEFFEKKFPKGYESIPGFDKVIQSMADNALTPLQEMELRQQIAKEDQVVLPDSIKEEAIEKLKDYYLD